MTPMAALRHTIVASNRIFNITARSQHTINATSSACLPPAPPHSPDLHDLHVPVMADEVLAQLLPRAGGLYIDATFGAGGHTRRILRCSPDCRVLALDRDADAHRLACELQREYPDRLTPLLGRFSELPALLAARGIRAGSVDGILFDFGCSSMQFDRAERGFAISRNGPLDMRMDGDRIPDQPTCADVLARIDEPDLARILKVYGEEKNAKKIARAICDMRYSLRRLQTTRELAELIASCFGDGTVAHGADKLGRPAHLATKTFQALRIFVNDELNEINYAMLVAGHFLRPRGRLVTLTFHSLEDTIVKRHMAGHLLGGAHGGQTANPVPLRYCAHGAVVAERERDVRELMASRWEQLHRHVLVPAAEEVERNARARSAKLRAAERVS